MEKTKNIKMKFYFTLIIFVLAIFLSGFFTARNVYAATTTSTQLTNAIADMKQLDTINLGDNNPTITETPYYILYEKPANAGTVIYMLRSQSQIIYEDNSYFRAKSKYQIIDYDITTRKWTRGSESCNVQSDEYRNIIGHNEITVLSANHNVMYSTGGVASDKVFFTAPNLPKLPLIIQPQPLRQCLYQVLILVPLLVGLVIGFLGLRKGLTMLHKILSQA